MINPRNPEICKSQREITIFLLFWSGKSLFSCFFWRRRPSKPGNLQITTGDHYFLAFLEWEITIFLFFFGGDDPRNPKICKSQREITIFLLFWSGKSIFSCFFLEATTLETGNLQITTGDHYFLAFLEWEITCSLLFGQAMTLETRKSANHNGRSLFSCFFGMGNPYFLVFFLQATTSKKARK